MIKNIIFDFGGVIYDIDHNLSKKAFESLGVQGFDELYGHQIQIGLFEKFERDEITVEYFRDALRKYLPPNVTDKEIDFAWNALLIGFDKKKIALLKSLRKRYKIYLLSNTNVLHTGQFMKELNDYTNFRDLFDGFWLSHEQKMRKPEERIYLGILDKFDLIAEETLFIDDLDTNIEAAKNVRIKTHYLQAGESILDLFPLSS